MNQEMEVQTPFKLHLSLLQVQKQFFVKGTLTDKVINSFFHQNVEYLLSPNYVLEEPLIFLPVGSF